MRTRSATLQAASAKAFREGQERLANDPALGQLLITKGRFDKLTIPGVYLTGDVALRDADGYYMVVGRADDVLNVAGHRIGSAEVESALVSHPSVAEAAVIGKPDPLKGEAIKGFVTLRVGNEPSDQMINDLKLHVRRELGPIAVPSEIEFMPVLPKTRSGKIMRRLLKANELGLDPGDITTLEE